MPVLDIVITLYLDSSYPGLGQRPGTVPEYGTCWALMWTHPFFKHPRQNLGTVPVRDKYSGTKRAPGPCVHSVFV